jgi:NAD(P)H dehydrogenase (quinone)
MAKILITYYSKGGNTEDMAKLVKEGVDEEKVGNTLKKAEEVKPEELLQYEGIIIGSPTYYGAMSWQIKKLLDESVRFHGQLEGKVGAAFTSSRNIGGGNETTILSILEAMLIHGMVIQGDSKGDHYGAVAIGSSDERAREQCRQLGAKTAQLVKKLFTPLEI